MAKRRPPVVHGTIVIDKPAGMTSHDVVGKLRKTLGERRIGHAGTLDPDATGVLVVGVGRATRLMQWVTGADKDYSCEVVLGSRTSTLDDSGEVLETFDMSGVSLDEGRRVIHENLLGDIEQVPPMVSALKVDGKRLHEYAREGVEIERKARSVHVARFDLEETTNPAVWRMVVTCSSGTYVRSLADDLGRLLGGAAHIRKLRRHRVGRFDESMCSLLDAPTLLPEEEMVAHLPRVDVDSATADRIANGAMLSVGSGFEGAGPWRVHGPGGSLLAVYEASGRQADDGSALVKPSVVLSVGG
ncbi:MAG: tRNA pseudouridine(55) synthase TruB [Ilumatobacteraceae bacterium]|nr:tRNA pseudouridine(55) synthase TruB [Ilumatobacteraceae bacterium]